MRSAQIAELLHLDDLEAQLEAVNGILVEQSRVANDALAIPGMRVIDGGGKRLRPILVIAAARAVGGSVDTAVLSGGAALELVHVGSLVHDDIIDHAATRRSVPTINAVEGPSAALLVGDFLLARAGYLASTISQGVATSLAVAISELCVGQSLETSTVGNAGRTIEAYYESINGKTASLIRAACRIGSQAGGGDEQATAALSEYGTNFGYAFQIVDDILDIVATSEALGKPSGHDMLEGVFTLPVLLFFEGRDELRAQFANGAVESVDGFLEELRQSDALRQAIQTARTTPARRATRSARCRRTLRSTAWPSWPPGTSTTPSPPTEARRDVGRRGPHADGETRTLVPRRPWAPGHRTDAERADHRGDRRSRAAACRRRGSTRDRVRCHRIRCPVHLGVARAVPGRCVRPPSSRCRGTGRDDRRQGAPDAV